MPIRPRNDITRKSSPDPQNAPIDAEPADAFEDSVQHVDVNKLSNSAPRVTRLAGRRRGRRNGTCAAVPLTADESSTGQRRLKRHELIVNVETARQVGASTPPEVLKRADKAIQGTRPKANHRTSPRRRHTMKGILCASLLTLLMPCAFAALPGDSADGKRLHDANCMGCHDTGIYTRKDRLVRSLDALKQQLGDCSHMTKKDFSAIEVQNIVKYLNDQFYQFR